MRRDNPTAVLWYEQRGLYLAHTRDDDMLAGSSRRVLLSASKDFVSWSREGVVGFDEQVRL